MVPGALSQHTERTGLNQLVLERASPRRAGSTPPGDRSDGLAGQLAVPPVAPTVPQDGQRDRSADDEEMSTAEQSLLMKALQGLGELPKIDSDTGTRSKAEQVQAWKVAMGVMLKSTRQSVLDWWEWSIQTSERYYSQWMSLPVNQRVGLDRITDPLPRRWFYIDAYFTPRIQGEMPARLNQQLTQEQQYGKQVMTADVLLAMLKYLRPDSVEDKQAVYKQLTSPNPCREPQAALLNRRFIHIIQATTSNVLYDFSNMFQQLDGNAILLRH